MTIKWIADNQMGEVQKDGTFTRAASYGVSVINAYFFDELSKLDSTGQEKNLILRKLKVLSYGFSWLKNDLTLVV